MSTYCANCGQLVSPGASFCEHCGVRVGTAPSHAPTITKVMRGFDPPSDGAQATRVLPSAEPARPPKSSAAEVTTAAFSVPVATEGKRTILMGSTVSTPSLDPGDTQVSAFANTFPIPDRRSANSGQPRFSADELGAQLEPMPGGTPRGRSGNVWTLTDPKRAFIDDEPHGSASPTRIARSNRAPSSSNSGGGNRTVWWLFGVVCGVAITLGLMWLVGTVVPPSEQPSTSEATASGRS